MATATLTNTPTPISTCEATTDFTGNGVTLDGLFYKQGSNSVSALMKASPTTAQEFYYTYPTGSVDLTNAHVHMWFFCTISSLLNTTNPIQLTLGDGSNTSYWNVRDVVGGGTAHPIYEGGWTMLVLDTSKTPTVDNSVTMTAITEVGVKLTISGTPGPVDNTWLDHIYYVPASTPVYDVYGGTSGDEISWAEIAAADAAGGWGIIQDDNGIYRMTGPVQIGDNTGVNVTWLNDQNVLIPVAGPINASYYEIAARGNGTGVTDIDMSLASILAGDNAYLFDFDDANITDLDIDGTAFKNAGVMTFQSGQSITNSTFINCGQITPSTAVFTGNTFNGSSDANGAILMTTHLTGASFVSDGTGHAIYITTPGSYTLTNCTYDGYGADATGDAVIYNNSGGVVTISVSGGDTPTVLDGASASTTVNNAVTVIVTVKDTGGTEVENAHVFIEAAAGGDLPVDESVTISRVTTTATVVHTAHGMKTGAKVAIRGADQVEYNGVFTITYIDAGSYSYQVSGTPTTPATGTITGTGVILNDLTNSFGIAQNTGFNYTNDQPISGWVRKSSASPFYKVTSISGIISSSGYTASLAMVLDE